MSFQCLHVRTAKCTPVPGETFPGTIRLAFSSSSTMNLVGMMEHPGNSRTAFRKLSVVPPPEECAAESSKDGKKKNAARSLWDLVKRKVTGKKGTPATTGKACALKPKPKTGVTPKKGTKGVKKGTKGTKGTKTGKKGTKTGKKGTKKGTKKTTRKGRKTTTRKRPTRKTTARKSRKGGRRGGRRGGRV